MATAESYEVNVENPELPNPNMTDQDFGSGKGIWAWFAKTFGGIDSEQQYQNNLTANNRAYELALLKEQRAYEQYVRNLEYQREDTKMQRLIKDYKAAGLNPWLAMQGGISGSSAQSQPVSNTSNLSGGSSAKSKDDKSSSGALSGLLIAVARLLASV